MMRQVGNQSDFIYLTTNYFTLKQYYFQQKNIKIYRTRWTGKPRNYKFTIYDCHKINLKKQRIATLVNFTHALDAAILVNVVKQCIHAKIHIFTIHDCFYINIPHFQKIIQFYNKAYVEEIIVQKPLEKFLLINKYPSPLPEVVYTEEDLDTILNAKFSLKI